MSHLNTPNHGKYDLSLAAPQFQIRFKKERFSLNCPPPLKQKNSDDNFFGYRRFRRLI